MVGIQLVIGRVVVGAAFVAGSVIEIAISL